MDCSLLVHEKCLFRWSQWLIIPLLCALPPKSSAKIWFRMLCGSAPLSDCTATRSASPNLRARLALIICSPVPFRSHFLNKQIIKPTSIILTRYAAGHAIYWTWLVLTRPTSSTKNSCLHCNEQQWTLWIWQICTTMVDHSPLRLFQEISAEDHHYRSIIVHTDTCIPRRSWNKLTSIHQLPTHLIHAKLQHPPCPEYLPVVHQSCRSRLKNFQRNPGDFSIFSNVHMIWVL